MAALIVKCGMTALVTALIALLLKETKTELSALCCIAGGTVICITALSVMGDLMGDLRALVEKSNLSQQDLKMVLKCIGICFLVDFVAGFCRHIGQPFLASALELAGKIGMCLLCIPFVLQVMDLVGQVFAT